MEMPASATSSFGVAARPDRRSVVLGLGLVLAVAVLAIAGGVTAAGVLTAGEPVAPAREFPSPAGRQAAGPFEVGDDVPTSFGAMSVKHAERINGLTSRDLAGMVHGVNGLIREDKSRMQASVTLTNLRDGTLRYTPTWFTLRTSKDGKPIKITAASLKSGVLEPDASIDVRIDFTAPRRAKRFWIDFADPAGGKPLTVALGNVKELASRRPASRRAQEALRASNSGSTTAHPGH